MKDPLRLTISDALLRPLDGDLFERCARGLLGTIFPNLARIPGGSDSGYDGAVVSEDSPRIPLACTVSPYDDARENLKRSLTRVRQSASQAERAFFASPQAFTPAQKRSLEAVARDRGFMALEVFDHEWFVDQLYRDDSWRKELLGITGRPSALSPVPHRRRLHAPARLVGRDNELRLLETLRGDVVLWGQPGVGKTFLLEQLAQDEWGYFLVDDDQESIADAIRRMSPRRIIIDDVHFQAGALGVILHLREVIGADFDIVVTTWPARKDEVGQRLGTGHLVEVPLLSLDEIARLVADAGVGGPPPLVQEIVRQARGRAGLAATLAQLCLTGRALDVARGDALLTETVGAYRELLDRDSALALAVISLAGDVGVDYATLRSILSISQQDLSELIRGLAHGGTIEEVSGRDGRPLLAVHPEALRFAAVKDQFFSTPGAPSVWDVVDGLPVPASALLPIIGAAHRGAGVDHRRVRQLLGSGGDVRAILAYAALGTPEAKFCLEAAPHLANEIAERILEFAPEIGLPVLLARAVGDNRPLNSSPDHALRKIEDYVRDPARPMKRRRAVLVATGEWLNKGGNPAVGVAALALALDPRTEGRWAEPGSGNTWKLQTGAVRLKSLEEFKDFWDKAVELATRPGMHDFSPLFSSLEEFCYPGRWGTRVPDDWARTSRAVARHAIAAMASRFADRPGVLLRLHRLRRVVNGRGSVPPDPDLEALYPEERFAGDYSAEAHQRLYRRHLRAARDLAQRWLRRSPAEVAARFAGLEREATGAGIHPYPRFSPKVAEFLAEGTDEPVAFLSVLTHEEAPLDMIAPFMHAVVRRRAGGWNRLVRGYLSNQRLRIAAIIVCLTEDVGDQLPKQAVDLCDRRIKLWIETARVELPAHVSRLLLRHKDPDVAQAAAVRLGRFRTEELVPGLKQDWETAVTQHPADDHEICDVLSRDPRLLERWVQAYVDRVGTGEWKWERIPDALLGAVRKLPLERRLSLLAYVAEHGNDRVERELVASLADDGTAAVVVFASAGLEAYRPALLNEEPDEQWLERALLALDAGMDATSIASASRFGGVFFGDASDHYGKRLQAFQRLRRDPSDVKVETIVRAGEEIFTRLRDEALAAERREAIYGR